MSAAAKYTADLLEAITPELARRIEIIADQEEKSMFDVVISFLTKGANTPIILGQGVSTSNNLRARRATDPCARRRASSRKAVAA